MPRPVDDDDDDRPRRRKRRDDDDDDDDRPRRKKKRGSKSESSGLIIVAAIVGILVLIGGGVGVYFATKKKPKAEPEVAEQPAPGPARNNQPTPQNPNPGGPENPALPGPPKATFRSVSIPSSNPFIKSVRFAGGEDGFAAVLDQRATSANINVVKTATGEAAGQIALPRADEFAVSPDGKWLAVIDGFSGGGKGSPVLLYAVADGKQVTMFTPYPRTAPKFDAPNLMWTTFVSKDQLLTINAFGGFDLWSIPEMKRTGGMPGKLTGGYYIEQLGAGGSDCPTKFSLTPDGKSLAMFTGNGFTFYDVQTQTETGKTEMNPNEMNTQGLLSRVTAAALSPDGERFASCYLTQPGLTSLTVWDAKTGKRLSTAPLDRSIFMTGGAAWWGPNHLVCWGPGPGAYALDAGSGKIAALLTIQNSGKYGTIPPNGQLWYITGETLVKPATGAAYLLRADAPPSITPGTKFQLTTDGLQVK